MKYNYLALHMNNIKCKPMLILSNVNSLNLRHLGPFNAQENIIILSREEFIQKQDKWLRKDE